MPTYKYFFTGLLALFAINVCTFLSETAFAQQQYYGAYGYYSLGSSRVLGLAGAYTSIGDDGNSIFHNPAGPSLGKWKYQFEGATNRLTNDEVAHAGYSGGKTIPSEFNFYFAGARLGNFTIALGSSTPYSVSLDEYLLKSSLILNNSTLLLSLKITETFGVGVGLHQSLVTENYQDQTGIFKSTGNTNFYSVGLRFGSNKHGFGFSYQPKVVYSLKNHDVEWFKDPVVPEKSSLGIHTSLSSRTVFTMGYDVIGQVNDAMAVDTPYAGSGPQLVEENMNILRAGLEMRLSEREHSGVTWRVGTYREPSRFISLTSRYHYTMGLEIQFGPAVLQVSTDTATGFSNSSQSFGLEFNKL